MIRPGQSVGTRTVAGMPRSASKWRSARADRIERVVEGHSHRLGGGRRVTASVNVVPTRTCDVKAASWRWRLRGVTESSASHLSLTAW